MADPNASTIPDSISKYYSGLILNQNKANLSVASTSGSPTTVVQEFYLPDSYKRGNYIPALTGFQIFINTSVSDSVSATYTLERVSQSRQKIDILGSPTAGTFTLTYAGQATGSLNYNTSASSIETALSNLSTIGSGNVEVNYYSSTSGGSYIITFVNRMANVETSNISVTTSGFSSGASAVASVVDAALVPVLKDTDGNKVIGNKTGCAVDNDGNGWFDIKFKSIEIDPSWFTNKFKLTVTFAANAINKIYYTSSNNPSLTGTINSSTSGLIAHRVCAAVADSGIDLLSNDYRSVVISKPDAAIDTITDANKNPSYWISKPNPSEFGIENLYFNFGSDPIVIDSVYLDPITPNVYFNVYYSNDPTGPGYDDDSWDNLTWTHVRKTFKATKKQNYVFPEPVLAKYVKVEFSHLQAQPYPVGTYQKAIKYKKHPKWVLDYFLASYDYERSKTHDAIIAGQVDLTYDMLDLAFNYYKDDIFQLPNGANTVGLSAYSNQFATNILTNTDDTSSLGWDTIRKINIAFRPFTQSPLVRTKRDSIIGNIVLNRAGTDSNVYSIEDSIIDQADTSSVSIVDREPLLLEKNFPVMYFYITCRHAYRESIAKFDNDKAYYVGVNEIAFQRNLHHVEYDSSIYIEGTGDIENVEVNDFVYSNNLGWTVL